VTWIVALLMMLLVSLAISLVVGLSTQTIGTTVTTAAEIVLAARTPADESTLRSPGSDVATSLRFENRTTRALDVHWLDFAGQRKRYATVEPGATYTNATYVGHVWVVAESSGEGLAIYVADTAPGVAILG
jgi:hypothetical protein